VFEGMSWYIKVHPGISRYTSFTKVYQAIPRCVYQGISRYFKIYQGRSRYIKVYKGISRYIKVNQGIMHNIRMAGTE
jgi:hypothetical protein